MSGELLQVIRSGRALAVDGIDFAVSPLVCVVPTIVNLQAKDSTELLLTTQADLSVTSAFEHSSLGRIQRWLGIKSLVQSLFSCRIISPRERGGTLHFVATRIPPSEVSITLNISCLWLSGFSISSFWRLK